MYSYGRIVAYAKLTGAHGLGGVVRFYQRPGGILVEAIVKGFHDDGFHGFHIHTGKAGGHYNPTDKPHPNHAGDLPPLLSAGGRAYTTVLTNRFSIREIIGRTVVIHENPDDFHTQPSGNPGDPVAIGTIQRFLQKKQDL